MAVLAAIAVVLAGSGEIAKSVVLCAEFTSGWAELFLSRARKASGRPA